jgi:hypothetical protein
VDDLHLHAVDGIVSAAQARELGVSAVDLRRMLRAGSALRLVRGWYAVRDPAAPRAPWEGEDTWDSARRIHRLTTIALVRSFEKRVIASHLSALVLHGVSTWQSDLNGVHLARTGDCHTRHRRGAVIHPPCGMPAVEARGCESTPPALAVVDVGLAPQPAGGPPRPFESLVAADSALHHGVLSTEDLAAAVEHRRGHPHIRAVRRLVEHADGGHETVGETRLAQALRLLGHATDAQYPWPVDGKEYRADLRIRGTGVLVEFDGMTKYLGSESAPVDALDTRRAFAAEKVRQDRMTETGAEFVRVTWPQLDDLAALGRRVDAAIARWRRRCA